VPLDGLQLALPACSLLRRAALFEGDPEVSRELLFGGELGPTPCGAVGVHPGEQRLHDSTGGEGQVDAAERALELEPGNVTGLPAEQ